MQSQEEKEREALTAYSRGDVGWRGVAARLHLFEYGEFLALLAKHGLEEYQPHPTPEDAADAETIIRLLERKSGA